mmetsp:Transcript_90952/g.241563  ORF Transcript_90952/g.241563 Transcript_90952/m.241563 type:complete len:229 (-) Transcript_90952:28-714(-)
MYFIAIPASFALCSGLFLLSHYATGANAEKSCSRVSAFHHFVAMWLGLWAHWQYHNRVREDASFGPNTEFPYAVLLQHFNIGYFLCDTVHVQVWDQRWLLHHLIALAGYTTSEMANVFALANAVNTWITELGSLMYSTYLNLRSEWSYILFVVLYTASRLYFAVWSLTVLGQVREALSSPSPRWSYPPWAPCCAATLQVSLLIVNLTFLATHWGKLWKRYVRGGKRKD